MKNTRLLVLTALVAVLFNAASAFTDANGKEVPPAEPVKIVDGPFKADAGENAPDPADVAKTKELEAQVAALRNQVAQLTATAQGLMQQRNALAQQALDSQLQLQQLQDQLKAAQQVTVAPAPAK